MRRFIKICLVFLIFFTQKGMASKFVNQFTEFELPPLWQCNLEGAEWVCQNTDLKKKKEAIIVLAAKLKGDQDSLDQYLTYLKAPKVYNNTQGIAVKSDPKYAKTINLNGQIWVDALHLESEVPGFYTRYLASIKQDIGVLITYSIVKAKYQDYWNDFDRMLKTLKVFRKPGGVNLTQQNTSLLQNNPLSIMGATDSLLAHSQQQNVLGGTESAATQGAQKKTALPLSLILAGVVIIGLIILKKRKSD